MNNQTRHRWAVAITTANGTQYLQTYNRQDTIWTLKPEDARRMRKPVANLILRGLRPKGIAAEVVPAPGCKQ